METQLLESPECSCCHEPIEDYYFDGKTCDECGAIMCSRCYRRSETGICNECESDYEAQQETYREIDRWLSVSK